MRNNGALWLKQRARLTDPNRASGPAVCRRQRMHQRRWCMHRSNSAAPEAKHAGADDYATIVVEGKSDTDAVLRALGPGASHRIFEVSGSNRVQSLRHRKIAKRSSFATALKQRCANNGMIVLADPDFEGMRMRSVLDWLLDGHASHAFVSAFDATCASSGDVGIENADPRAIRNALLHRRPVDFTREVFTRDDLYQFGLVGPMHAKPDPQWRQWGGVSARRFAVSLSLGFGAIGPQSLQRCLNRYNFTRAELAAAVETMLRPDQTRQLIGIQSSADTEIDSEKHDCEADTVMSEHFVEADSML